MALPTAFDITLALDPILDSEGFDGFLEIGERLCFDPNLLGDSSSLYHLSMERERSGCPAGRFSGTGSQSRFCALVPLVCCL